MCFFLQKHHPKLHKQLVRNNFLYWPLHKGNMHLDLMVMIIEILELHILLKLYGNQLGNLGVAKQSQKKKVRLFAADTATIQEIYLNNSKKMFCHMLKWFLLKFRIKLQKLLLLFGNMSVSTSLFSSKKSSSLLLTLCTYHIT